MPRPQPAASPLLALGMNAAPFNLPKREAVRSTMLQHESVRAGRIVFRFVVGSLLVPKPTAAKSAVSYKRWKSDTKLLQEEIAAEGDILQVDAIDGPGVAMECPAAEKTIQWLRYALRTWPRLKYVGKTEDDTYVHIDMLELELLRLSTTGEPNIV